MAYQLKQKCQPMKDDNKRSGVSGNVSELSNFHFFNYKLNRILKLMSIFTKEN